MYLSRLLASLYSICFPQIFSHVKVRKQGKTAAKTLKLSKEIRLVQPLVYPLAALEGRCLSITSHPRLHLSLVLVDLGQSNI